MGIGMKKFRATPEQVAKCRRNVMRLHRQLLVVHVIGLSCVCLFAMVLLVRHLTN